ncbi:hypothetical protein [Pedobacter sp.]|nr:hypothetical protein [Pedobacter sp.]HWW39316.1 hypothetical protein [Pedobacter sp.]
MTITNKVLSACYKDIMTKMTLKGIAVKWAKATKLIGADAEIL